MHIFFALSFFEVKYDFNEMIEQESDIRIYLDK